MVSTVTHIIVQKAAVYSTKCITQLNLKAFFPARLSSLPSMARTFIIVTWNAL